MTTSDLLFSPTLRLKRLKVTRGSHVAYDEEFHKGVNVLIGGNASGKSTIMNFVFFILGGVIKSWSDHAQLCDEVWAEVSINGKIATLKREIAAKSMTPMSVFGGPLSMAERAPISSWKKYPYSRSKTKESFSQAIFQLLDIPEAETDDSGTLTIHQLLRLIYGDQMSPVEDIFRYEDFDRRDIREAVGSLIIGAYTNKIYDARQILRQKEKSLTDASSELRSLRELLNITEQNVEGADWAIAERAVLEKKKNDVLRLIAVVEVDDDAKVDLDSLTLKAQQEAAQAVQLAQKKLAVLNEEVAGLRFSIADSEKYIQSLQRRINELLEAHDVSEHIDRIVFSTCPACYAPVLISEEPIGETVDEVAVPHSHCSLCKEDTNGRAETRLVTLISDANVQLRQSKLLQSRRAEKLLETNAAQASAEAVWQDAANEYQALKVLPTTMAQKRIRDLFRQLGYMEREIADADRKIRLAKRMDELAEQKAKLTGEIVRVKDLIEDLLAKQAERRIRAHGMVEKQIIKLLSGDLERQDTFKDPKSVEFSFATNSITVDDSDYFSASSTVYLRNSFLIGLFAAALKDPQFRHPRILLLDSLEDKGMEPARVHNIQNLIVKLSREARPVHQVIFATSIPSAELTEAMRVGHISTELNKTLNLV